MQTSATLFNSDSSRSHTILRIRVESSPRPDASDLVGMQPRALSFLNIIDLAGSESARVGQPISHCDGTWHSCARHKPLE